ncbi:MAG: mycothiol synthase [Acidimicrobiales bacterium]
MARLEVKRQMGRADIDAVSELLAVATEVDHHHPLGEHQWLDLVQGGREGFAGLVAWEPGHGHPVGYAQLSRGPGRSAASWALEFVVDPHHRDRDPEIGLRLVKGALDIVREEGGGHVHLWVPKPTPLHDRIAEAAGLRRGRQLLQMRRPLPVEGPPADLAVRPFMPGFDEEAWLAVNNRAFHNHNEQGGWDLETLQSREEQDWFDPAGFLLHERNGRLAGYCWTKVHRDHEPPLGEIYVVATDPDFQGQGLGRRLVTAGLDWLWRTGLQVGMLYVDRDNAPAVRLYESMGFTVDHVDQAYTGDVYPRPTPTIEPSA